MKMDKSKKFRLLFYITGILSTAWFLIRVIPKPSRATYPCMRAASPIAASFVIYLISITGSFVFLRRLKTALLSTNFKRAGILFFVIVFFLFTAITIYNTETKAEIKSSNGYLATAPVGTPKGVNPGRVVWVYNPDVTRDACTNIEGDYWWEDTNTDMTVVQEMLDDGIKKAVEKATVKDAWNAIFHYHNKELGRGDFAYTLGEKIYIKMNFNPSYGKQDHAFEDNEKVKTSPHLLLAVLSQLVNELGVNQYDIFVGDPYRAFPNVHYNMCSREFPDVQYVDHIGGDGRKKIELSEEALFFTSDPDDDYSSVLPTAYVEASYFINMPCLKSHHAAGVTLTAKNHQGSVRASDGNVKNLVKDDLHYCFPSSPGYENMGQYRHLVDYMGHKYMGGNTAINIVDAIWSGNNAGGWVERWHMAPFNNDWTSSLIISLDRVAIEAVCYDFLYEEWDSHFDKHKDTWETYPTTLAVNDYMVQAADPSQWAVNYDPENDGSKLESLGVYERWNNSSDKQYSQNLGIGQGIHLVSIPVSLVETIEPTSVHNRLEKDNAIFCAPNPASIYSTIHFSLDNPARVILDVYDLSGKKIVNLINEEMNSGNHKYNWSLNSVEPGLYICRISTNNNNSQILNTTRITVY
jgi:hypothetical protein